MAMIGLSRLGRDGGDVVGDGGRTSQVTRERETETENWRWLEYQASDLIP